MSKIVFLCFRNGADNTITPSSIDTLSGRLCPDNVSANPPTVIERNGILIGILNPNSSVRVMDTSVCVGYVIDPSPQWGVPLSPIPNGAYALFRSDAKTVELATDMVASRTIWYVQTGSMFVASTSQRAIVFFLQSFEPNEAAFAWMLSSGSLGLGNSWDKRIKYLTPDTRLHLDRRSWRLTCEEKRARFDFNESRIEQQYESELREALEHTFTGLSLDYTKWALALSGGVDSRAILLKIKDRQNLQCITWGTTSAITNKDSDAYIARRLAEHLGLSQRYFVVDSSSDPLEKVFDRFFSAGEGRIDHIASYWDGFQIWKWLFDNGFLGVIRGEQVFGWDPRNTDAQVRSRQLMMLQDYGNLQAFKELFNRQFVEQPWPEWLKREDGESLATWSDRLKQELYYPVVQSALTDLKCSYVEVVTPFLSHRVINVIRTIPDSLRTSKYLFRKIVTSDDPNIPYAKSPAIPNRGHILRTRDAVDLMSDALNSSYFRGLFSNNLIDHILVKYRLELSNPPRQRLTVRSVARRLLPNRVRRLIGTTIYKPTMDYSILAFRTYLAGKVNEMYSADASEYRVRKCTD